MTSATSAAVPQGDAQEKSWIESFHANVMKKTPSPGVGSVLTVKATPSVVGDDFQGWRAALLQDLERHLASDVTVSKSVSYGTVKVTLGEKAGLEYALATAELDELAARRPAAVSPAAVPATPWEKDFCASVVGQTRVHGMASVLTVKAPHNVTGSGFKGWRTTLLRDLQGHFGDDVTVSDSLTNGTVTVTLGEQAGLKYELAAAVETDDLPVRHAVGERKRNAATEPHRKKGVSLSDKARESLSPYGWSRAVEGGPLTIEFNVSPETDPEAFSLKVARAFESGAKGLVATPGKNTTEDRSTLAVSLTEPAAIARCLRWATNEVPLFSKIYGAVETKRVDGTLANVAFTYRGDQRAAEAQMQAVLGYDCLVGPSMGREIHVSASPDPDTVLVTLTKHAARQFVDRFGALFSVLNAQAGMRPLGESTAVVPAVVAR